jgi:hypothetical protein
MLNLNTNPIIVPDKIINTIDNREYFVYNVSKNMSNFSQLKSKYVYTKNDFKANGYSFCNVTTIGMGLSYLGYENKLKDQLANIYPELDRLPDKLAKFMFEDQRVLDFYKSKFSNYYAKFDAGEKDAYGPTEIHTVLSFATNLFLNCGNVTYFSTNTSWVEILYDLLYKNSPVGISGKFNQYNHVILLVGCAYKTLSDNIKPGIYQQPDFLIVDDPFGKTYEYEKGLSGNDIWIEFDKCVEDFKNVDDKIFKFSHRFIRPEYLGI